MTTLNKQSYYLIMIYMRNRFTFALSLFSLTLISISIKIFKGWMFRQIASWLQSNNQQIKIYIKIVMITRVIKQLQLALPKQTAFCFSGSDKFKNKGKGGLFAKNKNKEQIKPAEQQPKKEVQPEKPIKPQKFLHKKQQNEAEVTPQKIPQKQEQKIIPKINQSEKAQKLNLKLRKVVQEQRLKQTDFIKKQKSIGLAQQIIDDIKAQNEEEIQLSSGDIVKPYPLQILAAYSKLSDSSQKLLDVFDSKDWQGLSSLLRSYQTMVPASYIFNNIHTLLINRQPAKYIEWISSTKTAISSIPEKILRRLLYKLIDRNEVQGIKLLTTVLQSKGIDIGYQFLDLVFADIDKNASAVLLRAIVPAKIQLALVLLETIQRYTPHQPKYPKESILAQNEGYIPGQWLSNLWFIAKQRHIFLLEFIQIFQKIAITHKKKINLIETHANGLFLDVIQTYYFGSHITSCKFNSLFSHVYGFNDFEVFMVNFRKTIMQYKIKTGKNPFPNIKNHFESLKDAVAQQNIAKSLFFFQLCTVQGGKQPFSIFENDYKLILKLKQEEQQTSILKDGLLCASKQNLVSQEQSDEVISNSHKKNENQQPEVTLSQQDIAKIQQFFYKNKDRQVISNKLCNDLGLNSQHISILASRNQKQYDPQAFNKEKLFAANTLFIDQSLNEEELKTGQIDKIAKQAYFLSEDSESQHMALRGQNNQQSTQSEDQTQLLGSSEEKEFENSSEKDSAELQLGQGIKAQDGQEAAQNHSSEEYDSQLHPLVDKISQFYKNQLKTQSRKQKNFLRRQLLKVVRFSSNPLDATKAAIKLGKPELAWTIFKQKIMRQTIKLRIMKNVDYVVRTFVLEHAKDNTEYKIHEIIDSLNRFNYNYIDHLEMDNPKTPQDQWNLENASFFESIYEKLQNFDHLIWQNIPQGNLKHDFWENTLVLERAEELLRLDAKGKLNNFRYQRQHYELQPKKVQQLFPQQLNWRDQLIYGLGISRPEQKPFIFEQDGTENVYIKFENNAQFRQYLLEPMVKAQCPPVQLKSIQTPLVEDQGEAVEGEQVVAEGEQVAAEGEQVQAAEGQQVASVQGEEVAAKTQQQQQAVEAQAEKSQNLQQSTHQPQQSETNNSSVQAVANETEQENANPIDQKGQPELMGQTLYEHSLKHKIKGFDYNAFMELTNAKFKPYYQKNYEQEQKEFIKYFLALQALVEQAYLHDNHALQKKLVDVQSYLKNPATISRMISHGLWNFDFVTVQQPYQYLLRSREFVQNFYSFKKYMGNKPLGAVPSLQKQKVQNFDEILHNRRVTQQLVQELLMKRHHLFQEAEAIVKIQPRDEVQELILWGLFNDEPIAIYMGEKLAMLTNQKIQHRLALLVSKYLSHRQQVPQSRVERCKEALRIVGRINRQNIYELSKDYEHITVRKHLRSYLSKRQKELDSSALNFMTRLEPTYSAQDTTLNLRRNISRGNLTL